MNKIAITGVSIRDRRIVSQALSYLTGFDLVRQTAYVCHAVKYNLNQRIEECSWSDLFTYTLSTFTERTEIERQFDSYISNGSVFHELAYLEALNPVNGYDKRKSEEYMSMSLTLKKVIGEYALREYDCIVHINAPGKGMGNLLQDVDQSLTSMILNCSKSFVIENSSFLPNVLEKLLGELRIEPLLPVQTALKRVGMEIRPHP